MMRTLYLPFVFILFVTSFISAQNTVGLVSYDPSKSYDGYNLFYPHNQPNVYLMDNCGEIVHTWEGDSTYRPGNTAYILDDGKLVRAKRPASTAEDTIWAGGGGGTVEILDWDNNLEWTYTLNNGKARLHHDIEPLPSGNILMIAWESKTKEEALQAGRDTNNLDTDVIWPDYVIEVDPTTDQVVWEWHAWDHLIQDLDSTKDNYGVVANHPELININFDDDGAADWIHCNSIDYNADLDQILLSTPFFNEVWVIDHSITTQQAKGSSGDLLYRWGNPQAYNRGSENDQKLFFNHDAHWVEDFVDKSHTHYGKIAVFNNRVGEDFSTVHVFNPPWEMYDEVYTLGADNTSIWGPTSFDLTIGHPTSAQDLYSRIVSGLQLLPNGNTLICSGHSGYTFEITSSDEIVWEYKTPLLAGNPATQGDTLVTGNNLTFNMKRYPLDYAAFNNRDLSQKGWIELEPDTTFCDEIIASIPTYPESESFQIYPNPANDLIKIEWKGEFQSEVEIFDVVGRKLDAFRLTGTSKNLDVSTWKEGVYFIEIEGIKVGKVFIAR